MPRRPDRVLRFAWNPGTGEAIEPPTAEAESGWSTAQRPAAQYVNALFNNSGHWLSYLAGPSLTVWASHVYPDADVAFVAPIRAAVDVYSEDSGEARYRYLVATTDTTGSCVLVSRRGQEWLLRRNFPGTPTAFLGAAYSNLYALVWSGAAIYWCLRDDPAHPDSGAGASALRDAGEDWDTATLPASPGTLRDVAGNENVGVVVASTSTKILYSNSNGAVFADTTSAPGGRQSGRAIITATSPGSHNVGLEISSDAGDGYVVRDLGLTGTWTHVQTITGVGTATSWRLAAGPIATNGDVTFVAYKTGISDPRLHISEDDGVSWAQVAAVDPPQNMTSLLYRDEVWVATCTTAPYAHASSDLEHWLPLDVPVGESGASLYDVVYGNNAWLLLSDDRALRGAPAIVTAEDSWSADPTPSVLGNAGYIQGVEIDDATPTDDQVLVYDSTTNTWIPTTLGSTLPTASAAGQVPVSTGAGTTYAAAALSSGGLRSARPAAAAAILGRTYFSTDVGDGELAVVITNGAGGYDWEVVNERVRVVSASATHTAESNESVFCDASGGAFAVLLPAAQRGLCIEVTKRDSSGNAVTITADGADLINGAGTFLLSAQYASILLRSDGSGWAVF